MSISPKLFRALHDVFGEEGGDDFVEYMNKVEDNVERFRRIESQLSAIDTGLKDLRTEIRERLTVGRSS